ncbi:hypothetical protein HNR46_000769 [Haloferula luteola]|uniref:Fibronectin type-III domain-containing protein n=1 Tax=Haloferula luteola TaxID=595692 RepID=A0A840VCG1_9BACT|nr:LamG-like jellyroll fold domain-containing protein [Haloferula luteola]MBB5350541.1 hypothetical protein [Haloferula luteola]
MKSVLKIAAMLAAFAASSQAQEALTYGPIHRYRFDNASGSLSDGSQLADSIGTAHASIRGSGASATGSGVRLMGGSSASAPYIDLPNGSVSGSGEIFPGLSEASYEVWLTVHSEQSMSRILDFGNNSVGEVTTTGSSFYGSDYLEITATVGTSNDMRFERGGLGLTGGGGLDITGATDIGSQMHVVVTFDNAASTWYLYKNGVQIGSVPSLLGPSTLDDVNVWLGRSNWSSDSNSDATFEEFRIYDYALSSQQVLGNYQAGPETVTSDPSPLAGPSAPSAPLNFSAMAGDTQTTLIWDAASDATSYRVYRSGNSGGPYTAVATQVTGLQYLDTGLSNGVTYYYVATASNEYGESGFSAEASATPQTSSSNHAPSFASSLLIKVNATQGTNYEGSISADASDPDAGDTLYFAVVGGPAWLSVSTDGTLSGIPSSEDVGTNQWTIQVTDGGGLSDSATLQMTVDPQPSASTYRANGETVVAGTMVSGSYSSTLSSDNSYEELREIESGGRQNRRYSYLEHVWTFDLGSGGSQVELSVEAYHSVNLEGDDFVFAYSTDGVSFTDVLTITKVADDNVAQIAQLPAGLSGSVQIRVKDTNRSQGNRTLDSLYIDALGIEVTP